MISTYFVVSSPFVSSLLLFTSRGFGSSPSLLAFFHHRPRCGISFVPTSISSFFVLFVTLLLVQVGYLCTTVCLSSYFLFLVHPFPATCSPRLGSFRIASLTGCCHHRLDLCMSMTSLSRTSLQSF